MALTIRASIKSKEDNWFYGDTAGASMQWDASLDEMKFTQARMSFSGAVPADHIIDFSGVTLPGDKNIIRAGSYGSPLAYGAASDGLLQMYGSQDANEGVDVVTFFYLVGTGSAGLIGDSALVESNAAGDNYPKTLEGGQFMAGLRSGAKLATASGDATAGMYGAWLKVYASVDSQADAGCKVAPLWVDNQMSCVVGGEEYAVYITCGASKVDAVFGLETTSSGWTYLFHFDETAYDQDPVSTSAVDSDGNDSDGSLKISLNGTTYYIPYYGAGKLAS